MRFAIFIPTCNAGPQFTQLLQELSEQSIQPCYKLIIDSSSTDKTVATAQRFGWETQIIPKELFNHGGTRQQAFLQLSPNVDYIIYLTQDILLYDNNSLKQLLNAFKDPQTAAAYGRQLPHRGASLEAELQRSFNYPAESFVKSIADKELFGIKTAFLSDTFAAYRVNAVKDVGGFPSPVPCAEDMYLGAKLLLNGWKIAYRAEAKVYHSHEFNLSSDFHRYYLTGQFQAREKWLLQTFGKSEGEGARLLHYQLHEAWKRGGISSIFKIIYQDAVKYISFALGKLNG